MTARLDLLRRSLDSVHSDSVSIVNKSNDVHSSLSSTGSHLSCTSYAWHLNDTQHTNKVSQTTPPGKTLVRESNDAKSANVGNVDCIPPSSSENLMRSMVSQFRIRVNDMEHELRMVYEQLHGRDEYIEKMLQEACGAQNQIANLQQMVSFLSAGKNQQNLKDLSGQAVELMMQEAYHDKIKLAAHQNTIRQLSAELDQAVAIKNFRDASLLSEVEKLRAESESMQVLLAGKTRQIKDETDSWHVAEEHLIQECTSLHTSVQQKEKELSEIKNRYASFLYLF